jgi:hypothetical protein
MYLKIHVHLLEAEFGELCIWSPNKVLYKYVCGLRVMAIMRYFVDCANQLSPQDQLSGVLRMGILTLSWGPDV